MMHIQKQINEDGTFNCGMCNNRFTPKSKLAKYCSRKCQWRAHKRAAKESERGTTGYYDKRVSDLREAGYLVIAPEHKVKLVALWELMDGVVVKEFTAQ
jgi:hypothetical protein